MQTIGPHRVAVPKAYYKVLLQKRNGIWEGIGFILSNSIQNFDYRDFIVSIDKVEELTRIDFFWQLNDTVENEVESSVYSYKKD